MFHVSIMKNALIGSHKGSCRLYSIEGTSFSECFLSCCNVFLFKNEHHVNVHFILENRWQTTSIKSG